MTEQMKTAIDHEKKNLHDSIAIIASEDTYKLLFDAMKILYERRELCRAVRENPNMEEYSIMMLKVHNDKLKKLLMI